MDMTPYQQSLLDFYRSHVELAGAPTVHSVTFPPFRGLPPFETTLLRGMLRMEAGEPPLWLHASLGDSARELGTAIGHEHQFIGIYESDAVELLRLVASARHFDAVVETLDHGHTCPLDDREDSALRGRGYSHVLLLGVDIYGSMIAALEGARTADVRGVPTRFLAALPITESDMRVKKEHGPAALLQSWGEQGRDPFTIRPSS
jgi:hypothetical protein